MHNHDFFTPEERPVMAELYAELLRETKDTLEPTDAERVRQYITRALESGCLQRNEFGMNPIITDLQTALIVSHEVGLSRGALLGIMLSDVLLCSACTLEDIERDFDSDVAKILQALAHIQDLYRKSAAIESENFRSLLITLADDIRVILIIIASRLNIMRQIKDTEHQDARNRVALEASYLYAPLAHKLGLYTIKSELEDLSLKYLETKAYYHIKEKLSQTKDAREAYIKNFIKPVRQKLEEAGLKFHIKARTKSIHSIWQKMKKQQVDVDGVYDLFAIRIILDSKPEFEKRDCWQVFSIVTDMYQSNPKRMRDWLSVPKSNGYESLHITVLAAEQRWVEVQIRTERMDDIAEHGLAAHWRYKGVKGAQGGIDEWLKGIRSALENTDGRQAMDQFKMDLVEDEVFVFTPKGDLFKLPMGATVLDFAYAIHTNVGDHCTGARIGTKNVTLKHKLHSGDQVEIQTQTNQSPKQDWLNIVTTSKARNKIRQSLKEMQAGRVALTKELLERKMKNRKIEMEEATLMHTINKLGFKQVTAFYQALQEGRLSLDSVLETYLIQQQRERGEAPIQVAKSAAEFEMPKEALKGKHAGNDDEVVIDQNLSGIEFQLAKCCNPIYGDEVFGFVSSAGGIKIHRANCPNAAQMRERFGYRILRARWAGKGESKYAITLHIIGTDDMGIVNNITSIISKEEKVQMRAISIDSNAGLFSGHLTVMLEDASRLTQLIKKLKTVRGVKNVTRA